MAVSDEGAMDGLALVRAIRADPELRLVPVLLLSAYSQQELAGLLTDERDWLVNLANMAALLALPVQAAENDWWRRADQQRHAQIEQPRDG